jgi:Domain of unknown function (DUF4440)
MHRSVTRRARSPIIVCAAFALGAVAVSARPPASQRTAAAVMAIEQEWLAALQRHDPSTLARILGREFIDSDSQGNAITRAQYLAYFAHPVVRPGPSVRQYFADTRVRFIAHREVAIVTGLVISRPVPSQTGASSNPQAVRHSRFTDVFIWRDARWQAVTGQETHFTPVKG